MPLYGFAIGAVSSCIIPIIRSASATKGKVLWDQKTVVLLKVGMGSIPHVVATLLLTYMDRFFLGLFDEPSVVADYAIAFNFGLLVFLVTDSYNKWYTPRKMQLLSRADASTISLRSIAFDNWHFILLACVSAISASGLYHLIFLLDLLDASYGYHPSLSVVICLAFLFQGFYFLIYPFFITIEMA